MGTATDMAGNAAFALIRPALAGCGLSNAAHFARIVACDDAGRCGQKTGGSDVITTSSIGLPTKCSRFINE